MEHYAWEGAASVKFFTQDCERKTESKKEGTPDVPTDRERLLSRKYGRTAADALPKPRYGMRCSDEPQLEQGDGDEQDSDTGDIAPALYQQPGVRGLARR
jgi:hypothetical protein